MIVCVTGGRNFNDAPHVYRTLDELHEKTPIALLAQGGASGADWCAYLWALDRGVHPATFDALWAARGKAAGPLRNKAMLETLKPDLLVAFPGGKGTENCALQAEKLGIPVQRA